MGASIARPPVKRPPEFKFRGQNGIVITKDRMIAASRAAFIDTARELVKPPAERKR